MIHLARDGLAKKRTHCSALLENLEICHEKCCALPSVGPYMLYLTSSRSLDVALQCNGLTVQAMRKIFKILVLQSAVSLCPNWLYSGPNVVRVFSARCKTVAL